MLIYYYVHILQEVTDMRPSSRFTLEIASICRGRIVFNVYDAFYEGKVVGFAIFNSENGSVFTNVKTNAVALSELNQMVQETAREIESCL